MTDIKLNILDGNGSKIWKVSRYRPAVSNETIVATSHGAILYKSSSLTKHNWHHIIGPLINAALLNVYFILDYHLFFRKKFIFSNVYISVNTIFECLYMFFGWERSLHLSTQVTWGWEGIEVIQNAYICVLWEGVWRLIVRTHLHYLFSCFWQNFCFIVSWFISRNLTEVRNSRVTKLGYETDLCKITSHFGYEPETLYRNSSFELLTRHRKH